jgi:hypothetical protein
VLLASGASLIINFLRSDLTLQIFRHALDLGELVIRREPKKRARIFESRFAADIHRSITAPKPEIIFCGVVYAYRPRMNVAAPFVQKDRGFFVIAEGLKVGHVVRFVSGDVTLVIDTHSLAVMRRVAFV